MHFLPLRIHMLPLNFLTPYEYLTQIAQNAKEKRLSLNMSQQNLAARSGVSLGSIQRFERTGKISLESLLKIALVLESLESFDSLFAKVPFESFPTIDAILKHKIRKRGRK
jgi:transcriptional regulator with XRE-family HTH domain